MKSRSFNLIQKSIFGFVRIISCDKVNILHKERKESLQKNIQISTKVESLHTQILNKYR